MPISIKEVEHIASLAKLKFEPAEKQRFTVELNKIIQYVEKLNELDTHDVEPLSHTTDITNVYREDVVKPSLPVEDALKNAPSRFENYFKVPKVIK